MKQVSSTFNNIDMDGVNEHDNYRSQKMLCTWCDTPRARGDLCDKCRQKVESRARRLMEQKLKGDVKVMDQVAEFLIKNIGKNVNHSSMTPLEYSQLLKEILPFLV